MNAKTVTGLFFSLLPGLGCVPSEITYQHMDWIFARGKPFLVSLP
jgi:hypothetical protein